MHCFGMASTHSLCRQSPQPIIYMVYSIHSFSFIHYSMHWTTNVTVWHDSTMVIVINRLCVQLTAILFCVTTVQDIEWILMNLFVNTETKQHRNRTEKNTKCRPDTKEGNASTNRSPISIKQFYKQTVHRKIKKKLLSEKIIMFTYNVPLSPCSIIWYWPKGDDALWLGKQWGDWKCETWKCRTVKNAGVENAGPENAAPKCRGKKCGTIKYGKLFGY